MSGLNENFLHFPYPLDRTLFLVGMMGSGKTSIGRRLARVYSMPFVDGDIEMEKAGGGDICYLFNRYGEQDFRRIEEKVMKRLLEGEPCILASGGGAFLSEATRKTVKEKAVSVFLDAHVTTIIRNTAGRTHRPLLNVDNPEEVVRELLEKRRPFYEQADLRVSYKDETMGQVLRLLVQEIHQFSQRREK
ncbi:MAG: shikimate kinase [Alphaproteobacteria bacterium]|nr:shikimate kinase [Alphaproteobacteria bacterium]MBO4643970.1 shikimate kinase [Alphaproteobacteria bacterium]